jgi:hypothetical protein
MIFSFNNVIVFTLDQKTFDMIIDTGFSVVEWLTPVLTSGLIEPHYSPGTLYEFRIPLSWKQFLLWNALIDTGLIIPGTDSYWHDFVDYDFIEIVDLWDTYKFVFPEGSICFIIMDYEW